MTAKKMKVPGAGAGGGGGGVDADPPSPRPGQGSPAAGSTRPGQRAEMEDTMGAVLQAQGLASSTRPGRGATESPDAAPGGGAGANQPEPNGGLHVNPQRKAFLPPPAASAERRRPAAGPSAAPGGGERVDLRRPRRLHNVRRGAVTPLRYKGRLVPHGHPPPASTQPALSAAPFLPPDWKTTLRGTSAHFGPIWMRGGGYLATGRRCSGSGVAIPGGTDTRVVPAAARSSPFPSSLSGGSRKKKRLEQTEAPARLRARSRSARAPDARARGPRIGHGFFFSFRETWEPIN